jgi:hypothetical protein
MYLDANLLVYRLLLILDLLLKLPELCAIGCCAIRLQYLDIPMLLSWSSPRARAASFGLLISERRDLLLLDLVVGEGLLVFLPARARCGRHAYGGGGGG